MEKIFSSPEIIVAIITGIISFLTLLFKSNRESKLSRITDERAKWRDNIRTIAVSIADIDISSNMNIDCEKNLIENLTKLKMNINSYGQYKQGYRKDHHIWKEIRILENQSKRNEKHKQKLLDFLSLLLKYDWERSKKETSIDVFNILGYSIYIIANSLFAYWAYPHTETDTLINFFKLLSIFAILFFVPELILMANKCFFKERIYLELIESYGIAFFSYYHFFFKDGMELSILYIPITLQIIAQLLLSISKTKEIHDEKIYYKSIKLVECDDKITNTNKNIKIERKSKNKIEKRKKKEIKRKNLNSHQKYKPFDCIKILLLITKKCILILYIWIRQNALQPLKFKELNLLEQIEKNIIKLNENSHNTEIENDKMDKL